MSVSFYLQAHLKGEDQDMEVSEIINSFEPFIKNKTAEGFDVFFDEMNISHIFINTYDKTSSNFSINRPCEDIRLYEAIYNCMKLGNVIFYGSDGDKFIILSHITLDHLPEEMKEHVTSANTKLIIAKNFDLFHNEI